MHLGACTKHRHGDKGSESKREGGKTGRAMPKAHGGLFFRASCLGEHLVCSPCGNSLGEVAVSSVSSPKFQGGRAGGAAVALAVENRIIPCCLFFGRVLCYFFALSRAVNTCSRCLKTGFFRASAPRPISSLSSRFHSTSMNLSRMPRTSFQSHSIPSGISDI